KYMKDNSQVRVSVIGHSTGNNESVLTSVDRAEYIKWRLEQCGISPIRIKTAGHGITHNLAGLDPDKFRRADITIDDGKHVDLPAARASADAKKIDIAAIAKNETIRI